MAYTPLATRLSQFFGLDPEDVAKLDALPFRQRAHDAGEQILGRGDRIEGMFLMISGWAARVRYTPEGSRQIIHILLPGDLVTDDVFVTRRIDHEFISLTKIVVRLINPDDFHDLFLKAPTMLAALWWAGAQEDGMLREQIVRLGRRSAIQRTCHLLLELHRRLLMVHQATDESFILPITQIEISDVLGLSIVHVNRTLKKLDDAGLIERRKSLMRLLDRESLAQLCDFDVAHFHLDSTLRQSKVRE